VGRRHAPWRQREQRRLAPGFLPTRGGVTRLEDNRPQDAACLLSAADRLEHICVATYSTNVHSVGIEPYNSKWQNHQTVQHPRRDGKETHGRWAGRSVCGIASSTGMPRAG